MTSPIMFKFETVVPEAFRVVAAVEQGRAVIDGVPDRRAGGRGAAPLPRRFPARDDVLGKLIPTIEEVLAAGGLPVPSPAEEAMPIAIPLAEASGDAGHRG